MMDIVFLTRLWFLFSFLLWNQLWKVNLLRICPQVLKGPQKPIPSLIKLPNIEVPSIELLNIFSTLTLAHMMSFYNKKWNVLSNHSNKFFLVNISIQRLLKVLQILINPSYIKWTPLEFKCALASQSTQVISICSQISLCMLYPLQSYVLNVKWTLLVTKVALHPWSTQVGTLLIEMNLLFFKYAFAPLIHSNKFFWSQMYLYPWSIQVILF